MKSLFKKILGISSPSTPWRIDGELIQGKNCAMINCQINIAPHCKLILGNNVRLQDISISIEKGELCIGDETIVEKGNAAILPSISIENGTLNIGHHSLIRAAICVRFDGKCSIGNYTGIMEQSEIRCDESIRIGDFNMISYECMIYDTNTHVNYAPKQRREITQADFPQIGKEREKPITKPVEIGNDCWLGKRAVVLKGCKIGNNATIATCALVTKSVPDNYLAYGNPALSVPK